MRLTILFCLSILFVFSVEFELHAQPAGKWYAGATLPGLTTSSVVPKLLFVDSLLGYYIGVDTGFITRDGGVTWAMMNFPQNARPSPTYIFAPNHNTIMSFQAFNTDINGTSYPGIIKSNDNGKTWTSVNDTLPTIIKTFTMWTETDGFRIWVDNNNHATAALTYDGGVSFTDTIHDATLQKYLPSFAFPTNMSIKSDWSDAQHGALSLSAVTVKAYPVLTTTDGGKSWTETYPALNGNTAILHSYVYLYPGSQSLWTIPSVPKVATYFFYSTNYGTSWQTTPIFNKLDLGSKTKPGIVKLAPVSPTASWAIVVSDSEHFTISQNTIAYKDFSGNWILSQNFPRGMQNGLQYYVNVDNLQFPDPNHGFFAIQKYIDTSKSTPALPVDTITIYRYYINPPNGMDVAGKSAAFSIFPNPASSNIKIQGLHNDEQLKEIKIFNMLGMKYSPPLINSGQEIELWCGNLPPGCYFVSISTSLRTEIIPVILKR